MRKPVLLKETIRCLNPKPNENFIDCTIDGGGHGIEVLKRIQPNGKLLGIDLDEDIIRHLKFKIQNSKFKNNLVFVCGSYVYLKEIREKKNFPSVNGILLDLGMSSRHIEESGRGFSFQKDEPLDMRYNAKTQNSKLPKGKPLASCGAGKTQNRKLKLKTDLTAELVVNKYEQKDLEDILIKYGEERFAKRIAKKIVEQREIKPIKTSFQLVEIIKKAIPPEKRRTKIHFATRTFQALRIAVNDELNNLKKVLPQAVEVLAPGGRLAIISFHSLEDRLVKNFFKNNKSLKILTKKPVKPGIEEIRNNHRARSAKLRAAIKISK